MRASKEAILAYLAEIKPTLSEVGVLQLALFGSFANGSQSVYSDIDIAIRKNEDYLTHNSSYDYFRLVDSIKQKITRKFHRNTDVFDLDSSSPLRSSIQKEMIVV